MADLKHVICYSGGIESAVTAIEVVRRYGKGNTLLINHDICPEAEDPDIKAYKQAVADYLGLCVEPVNASEKFGHLDPILCCIDIKAFKVGKGQMLCTSKLKTEPFKRWLSGRNPKSIVIHYGFTNKEKNRCARRLKEMQAGGWQLDFPLLWSHRTIYDTAEVGIPRPTHYSNWCHGNCIGCLKAGWQHWYCVYVHRRDRWDLAKSAESKIGYTINRRNKLPCSLASREAEFEYLQYEGLPATEWTPKNEFWKTARNLLKKEGRHE